MKLLEGSHRVLVDNMITYLTTPVPKNKLLMSFGDFHGSTWTLAHDGNGTLYIALYLRCKKSRLVKWGLMDQLNNYYGEENVVDELDEELAQIFGSEPDVVVKHSDDGKWRDKELTKSENEKLENLCVKYGSLYKVAMMAVFEFHFEKSNDDELFDPVKISYRDNESLYIAGTKDNLSVFYSMWLETEDDLLYGKLFLKEFADAKKHHRNIAGAPSCDYFTKRPAALSGVKGAETDDEHRVWVVLSLFRKHTDTKPEVLESTTDLLLQFRNYVHYHISCSHAYIHSRMRSRHTSLLKVLNRAKTNQTDHVAIKIQ